MSTRRPRFRTHAWEPLTMTWAEVADAVFRRNEAWLRQNFPEDFPRPHPLYALFHVDAVEAWARRAWKISSEDDGPEDVAARIRERMCARRLSAPEAARRSQARKPS